MCDRLKLRPGCAYAQSDQSLCLSLEYSMSVNLLTGHHLEFNRRLHRLVWVYTCQNVTLLEITCRSSNLIAFGYLMCLGNFGKNLSNRSMRQWHYPHEKQYVPHPIWGGPEGKLWSLLINYSIYTCIGTYIGKCVIVVLVTFVLSYSPYLILPQTYTAYLGPIQVTLDNMKFTLDNMNSSRTI